MSNTTEILVSASMFGKLYSKMIMEVADKYSMNKVEVDILLFLIIIQSMIRQRYC